LARIETIAPPRLRANHVLPGGARAVERAVEDDPDHRVPAVRRQLLGAADEVAGGVVDQDVEAAEVLHRALDHLVDLLGLAHVELHGERVDAGGAQRGAPGLEMLRVAAGDGDARAERAQPFRDGETDPRAAAGDHRDPIVQQALLEHDP
jgi:hypothetical protein